MDREQNQTGMIKTRNSLLSGLRESKSHGLRLSSQTCFFETYQPLLLLFFLRKGLQRHDADDLAQQLVMKLIKRLERKFDVTQDEKFRSYLFSAAHNGLKDFYRELKKSPLSSNSELSSIPEAELRQRIEEQVDLDLLDEAKKRVRQKVAVRDWELFLLLTESNAGAELIADRYGISRNATDNIKYRIVKRLKREVESLKSSGLEGLSK